MPNTGSVAYIDHIAHVEPCSCINSCRRTLYIRRDMKTCPFALARKQAVYADICKRHEAAWHVKRKCITCYPVKECVFDYA